MRKISVLFILLCLGGFPLPAQAFAGSWITEIDFGDGYIFNDVFIFNPDEYVTEYYYIMNPDGTMTMSFATTSEENPPVYKRQEY